MNFYSPRHVRKLIAECPHDIGVLRRRYADPLKYASRGSTLSADDDDDCADISKEIIKKFTAKEKIDKIKLQFLRSLIYS